MSRSGQPGDALRCAFTALTLALVAGCGGAQGVSTFRPLALATPADASADAFASLEAELRGDLEEAFDLAAACMPAAPCAARVAALSARYPVLVERLASEPLPAAVTVEGALWSAQVERARAWQAHRRGLQSLRTVDADLLAWERVGPVSSFAYLDLVDTAEEPFPDGIPDTVPLESGSARRVNALVGRSGGVAAGAEAPGLYVLQSTFQADGAGWLALDAAVAHRAWVDGREVHAVLTDSALRPSLALIPLDLESGEHRLTIAAASVGGGSGVAAYWLDVPSAGEGAAPRGVGAPHWLRPQEGADVQARAYAIEASLLAGDPSAYARWCGDDGALHAVEKMLCTRLATEARDRTMTARLDAALSHAADVDPSTEPSRALDAIEIWRALMQDERAQRALEALVDGHPGFLPAASLLAQTYEDRGWTELARPLRERVMADVPHDCETAEALLQLLEERAVVPQLDSVPQETHGCRGVALEFARRVERARGDDAAAVARIEALFEHDPSDAYVASILYGWLSGQDAEDLLAVHRAWSHDALVGTDLQADRELATGTPTGDWRAIYASEAPGEAYLVEALDFAGVQDPLAGWRFDGADEVAAYLSEENDYTGDIVLVLDASTTLFQPNGARLEIVHQIAELRTRDALAAYGEVAVAANADILTVRTLKRDGSVLLPEAIGDRDAISLPELEVGDFIELEWMQTSAGTLQERPAGQSPRFFFRGSQGPYHRSVARYVVPSHLEAQAAVDARHLDGVEQRVTRTHEGDVVYAFEARAALPPAAEGMTPAAAEWLPSVRVAVGTDEATALRRYAEGFAALVALPTMALGYDGEVEAWLETLLDGSRNDRERVQRIFRYVSDEVADVGSFLRVPASWTLRAAEGERAPLLFALLEAAGFAPEFVFVRTYESDPTDGPIPEIGEFDLSALHVRVGGQSVWLEPDFERYPFDYLRPAARGRSALVVAGPRAGQRVQTPTYEAERDRSEIRIAVEVDERGDAVVQIDEIMPVRQASNLRSYVQSAEDARQIEQDLEGALASSFPRVSDLTLELRDLEDPDVPLHLTYRFSSGGLVQDEGGGRWRADAGFFLRPLDTWYGSSASRTLPLAIVFPIDEEVRVDWIVPEAWRVQETPADIEVEMGVHSASREASASGGDVTIERHLTLRLERITVEAFPAFRAFLEDATETMDDVLLWQAPRAGAE